MSFVLIIYSSFNTISCSRYVHVNIEENAPKSQVKKKYIKICNIICSDYRQRSLGKMIPVVNRQDKSTIVNV